VQAVFPSVVKHRLSLRETRSGDPLTAVIGDVAIP
jgi:hypothetical protein